MPSGAVRTNEPSAPLVSVQSSGTPLNVTVPRVASRTVVPDAVGSNPEMRAPSSHAVTPDSSAAVWARRRMVAVCVVPVGLVTVSVREPSDAVPARWVQPCGREAAAGSVPSARSAETVGSSVQSTPNAVGP